MTHSLAATWCQYRVVLSALITSTLLSCHTDHSVPAQNAVAAHYSMDSAHFQTVCPLANGGAYTMDDEGAWWYLKGTTALSVIHERDTSVRFVSRAYMLPLASGSAYAFTYTELWFLHENLARPVKEVQALRQMDTLESAKDGAIWAMLMANIKRQEQAAIERDEEEPEAERQSDAEDPIFP